MSAGGVISHLRATCGSKGVVGITASSVSENDPECTSRNAADLGTDSYFSSRNEPGQGICWDFKTLRIEPTHYTIRTQEYCDPLKS